MSDKQKRQRRTGKQWAFLKARGIDAPFSMSMKSASRLIQGLKDKERKLIEGMREREGYDGGDVEEDEEEIDR